jgi:hypothetical protein
VSVIGELVRVSSFGSVVRHVLPGWLVEHVQPGAPARPRARPAARPWMRLCPACAVQVHVQVCHVMFDTVDGDSELVRDDLVRGVSGDDLRPGLLARAEPDRSRARGTSPLAEQEFGHGSRCRELALVKSCQECLEHRHRRVSLEE